MFEAEALALAPPRAIEMMAGDSVAVVCIEGPLCQRSDAESDGYDTITDRVALALASPARAVVLKINSPGGALYGAIDAAKAMRARATAARKPLIAYVDGEAASAAYALAVVTDRIILGTNAIVGSIGVLEARADVSVANAARGLGITLIASGAKKVYGHPEVPLTEAELTATQDLVNALAQPFLELVAMRRGLTLEGVAGLEAGLFTGPSAITARLADRLMPFEALILTLSKGTSLTMDYQEIIAALQATAEGDDPNAASAKKMLAALEGDNPEAEADAPAEDEPDGDEPPAAEDDTEDPEAADDADPPTAAAPSSARGARAAGATVSARTAGDLASQLAEATARIKRLESAGQQGEIDRLLAPHPKALRAALRGKPLADVRAIVAALPKPGRLPPVNTLSSPDTIPATKPLKPVASREIQARIDRATGLTPRAQKRTTKLINGALFFDVPEDYDPNTHGQA
jgi:ClpP class serine protease